MIRRISALSYKSLRYIDVELADFHILVGPNASGKSTFLDVVHFISDLLTDGLEPALARRSPNFANLTWLGSRAAFQMAIEVELTAEMRRILSHPNGDKEGRSGSSPHDRARYELAIGPNQTGKTVILHELLMLQASPRQRQEPAQREMFPAPQEAPESITFPPGRKPSHRGAKTLVKKTDTGNDYFRSELTDWNIQFRIGPERPALVHVPDDSTKFPVSLWVRKLLMDGVDFLLLNSEAMRRASPPGSPREFRPDGSNLPFAVEHLKTTRPDLFAQWIDHVRTALPDIRTIETIERPEDKHRYLRIAYETGLQAPSWTISDGTLRLLALTLIAYLPQQSHLFLVEEPENGVHPKALETVFQSFSSCYENQVLCASHSPIFLSLAEPEQVLCFGRSEDGATDIIRGSEHPNLRAWRRTSDLGTLLATGILG